MRACMVHWRIYLAIRGVVLLLVVVGRWNNRRDDDEEEDEVTILTPLPVTVLGMIEDTITTEIMMQLVATRACKTH